MTEQTQKLYLLDASGFIFRAYHALPPLTRPDGTPVGAVMGFCNILYKLLSDLKASHVGVIFDAKRLNWRHNVYEAYKAHRPEPPEDLIPQFEIIRDATRAFGFDAIDLEDYEADDLIACYTDAARAQGMEVVIVSSDKDLMQLIKPHVTMWDPIKQKTLSDAEVFEKFGVTPDKVIDVQALIGDATDNVPGIPGIGPKTAAELINTYGDLDTVLERGPVEITKPKLKESLVTYAEQARISRQLVTLECKEPLPVPLEKLETPKWNSEVLRDFLKLNNFKTLLARVGAVPSVSGVIPAKAGISTIRAEIPDRVGDDSAIEKNYILINTLNNLNIFLEHSKTTGLLAFDTETTGLTPAKADLVGISLCHTAGQACYIPLGHKAADTLFGDENTTAQLSEKEVILALAPYLTDASLLKVAHNAKYDLQFFLKHGVEISPLDDTMLISYSLDGGQTRHGLDELALKYCGHSMISYESVAGKNGNFAHVPIEKAVDYAAEDADYTLRLWHALKPRLITERLTGFYEQIERPFPSVIAEMENNGIKVDTSFLTQLENEFSLKANALEENIYTLAGGRFMLSSPKQLGEVLFERLALPGGKRTKSGQWSTDADALEKLATETGHPAMQKILEWRQLTKLISTYTRALVEAVNPKTGRVHTSYSLAAITTGRLSSNDPNLQNIPIRTEEGRKIRTAFISEEGYKLISADYSQIELRLIAEIGDVKGLKAAFASGQDIHAFTARQVFGIADDQELPSDMRRAAKAINFGIIYGQSAFGLAQGLGIPRGEAADFINAYFAKYPEIKTYMERVKQEARDKGYVETLFGRHCWIPNINDKNPMMRAGAERAAINAPIQGSAADLIKMAMIAIYRAKLPARMLLQVHDELILEVREDLAESVAAQVKDIMENVVHLSVPIKVEAGVGDNWGSAH